MATNSGGVQTQLAAERQQDYYTSQECRDQPGARRLPAQQFVLQLWSNRTLRPTVSQEHQARRSISAASQLHGAVFHADIIQGQVHHISADEAQEDPEVVIGMFLVNDIPAVILFDSGFPTLLFRGVLLPKTIFLA